ncbi:hypothetical protein MLD38_012505 [Melastoma candidum]|uniref:Uncharacterized protein n=1 Tax=Melastoma candidum TaxID=119954 RepID=A0ACB9R600_9MYRT|nr:hypothetical protein MLD38_012505 [Melastoma candidum]
MCKHSTHDREPRPENPDRIRVIWDKLQAAGITRRWMECKGHALAQLTRPHRKKLCGRLSLIVFSSVGNQHGHGV